MGRTCTICHRVLRELYGTRGQCCIMYVSFLWVVTHPLDVTKDKDKGGLSHNILIQHGKRFMASGKIVLASWQNTMASYCSKIYIIHVRRLQGIGESSNFRFLVRQLTRVLIRIAQSTGITQPGAVNVMKSATRYQPDDRWPGQNRGSQTGQVVVVLVVNRKQRWYNC